MPIEYDPFPIEVPDDQPEQVEGAQAAQESPAAEADTSDPSGSSFSSKLRDVAKTSIEISREVVEQAGRAIARGVKGGIEEAGTRIESGYNSARKVAQNQYKKAAKATRRGVKKGIDTAIKEPKIENTKVRKIVDLALHVVPGREPLRQFDKALKLDREALENGSEEVRTAARREALLAAGNMGIDIGAVIAGGVVARSKAATWFAHGAGTVFFGSRLVGNPLEPLMPAVNRALNTKEGRDFADSIIRVGRELHQTETAGQSKDQSAHKDGETQPDSVEFKAPDPPEEDQEIPPIDWPPM